MKRFISFMLAALFLCTVAGAETDILFDRELYGDIQFHCVGMSDRLYTFVSSVVKEGGKVEFENGYTVTYDFSEPIAILENEYPSDLYGYSNGSFKPLLPAYFPGTNGLYHLYLAYDPDPDVLNYHICSVDLVDDKIVGLNEICVINMYEIDEYFIPDSHTSYMCGEHLLMLYSPDIDDHVLIDYDAAEGDFSIIETDPDGERFNIEGICQYDDVSVLIFTLADCSGGSVVKIYKYTPEEEAFDELAVLERDITARTREFYCPAYDASTDTLYYCENGKALAMRGFDTDDVRLLGNVDESMAGLEIGSGGCIVNGVYVLYNCMCIQIIDESSGEVKKNDADLNIFGFRGDAVSAAASAYSMRNSGANVNFIEQRPEGSSISADIISQSDAFDIYMIKVSSGDFASMAERGFLLPIQSDALDEFGENLYPQIRGVLGDGEHLFALPYEFEANVLAYDPTIFEALGLTEDDVPTTWREFVDLLTRMPEMIEDTDYYTFLSYDTHIDLVYEVVKAYCREYVSGNRIDQSEMCALINDIMALDLEAIGWEQTDVFADMLNNSVFFKDNILLSGDNLKRSQPMLLSLGGEAAKMNTRISVLVINPYSSKREKAIEFMELVLDFIPQEYLARMRADWEGGVKRPNADDSLAEYDKQISLIEESIAATSSEDEIEEYEEMLSDVIYEREYFLENAYWEISPEAFDMYREYAQTMAIDTYLGLDFENEIAPVVSMYMDGGMSTEAMLKEITRKINYAAYE